MEIAPRTCPSENSSHPYPGDTTLLIGTLLKQLGRRACEIKPAELARFTRDNEVRISQTTSGAVRYEIVRKRGD